MGQIGYMMLNMFGSGQSA